MVDIFGFPDDVFAEPFGGSAPGGLTPAQAFAAVMAAQNPLLWYKLNETSGTTVINYGSAGASANGTWTAGAGALGQAGKLGANEAYDFDALASKIVIPDIAAIQALATYTIMGLCKADGAGENNAGTVLHLGASAGMGFRRSTLAWSMGFDTDGTDATSTSNSGFVANDVWLALFGTFDNAGDRTARIYKGSGGVVTEATYATQTAASGTRVAPLGAVIGNFSDVRTWDGLIDEVVVFNRVLSAAEMLQITAAAGV